MQPTERAVAALVDRDWDALTTNVLHDSDARVRASALAALVRGAPRRVAAAVWKAAAADSDRRVRLRAAQLAPTLGRAAPQSMLLELLADDDVWVAEAAAFAIGESPAPGSRSIAALVRATTEHSDPLVREAAVAALGAIGEPSTVTAVLAACDDKPAIRRRAVLALAAFEGDEVEARLHAALEDHDWQVRQAAEDLLHADSEES
jgi:HEAT repeat protein